MAGGMSVIRTPVPIFANAVSQIPIRQASCFLSASTVVLLRAVRAVTVTNNKASCHGGPGAHRRRQILVDRERCRSDVEDEHRSVRTLSLTKSANPKSIFGQVISLLSSANRLAIFNPELRG